MNKIKFYRRVLIMRKRHLLAILSRRRAMDFAHWCSTFAKKLGPDCWTCCNTDNRISLDELYSYFLKHRYK